MVQQDLPKYQEEPSRLFSRRRKVRSLPSLRQKFAELPTHELKQRGRKISKARSERIKFENEIRDADTEHWLRQTGRFPESRWQIKEKRALKDWFNKLDRDGSGEIDVEELTDPLLSTGLAKNIAEVKRLVNSVDHDKSGAIGFSEFLFIMRSKQSRQFTHDNGQHSNNSSRARTRVKGVEIQDSDKWTRVIHDAIDSKVTIENEKYTKKGNTNPIVKLQALQEEKGGMKLNTILAFKRRELLLDATIGEAQRREKALDKIRRWRMEMNDLDVTSKLKALYEIAKIMEKLEFDQREKGRFVTALRDVLSGSLKDEEIEEVFPANDFNGNPEILPIIKGLEPQ